MYYAFVMESVQLGVLVIGNKLRGYGLRDDMWMQSNTNPSCKYSFRAIEDEVW